MIGHLRSSSDRIGNFLFDLTNISKFINNFESNDVKLAFAQYKKTEFPSFFFNSA